MILRAKWRDYLNLKLADVAAPALAAGTRSAGSAASFLATAITASRGTARGRWATGTAWCRPGRCAVDPTLVYETLVMGFGAFLLWRLRHWFRFRVRLRSPRRRRHRALSGRVPAHQRTWPARYLTESQFDSLAMILGGPAGSSPSRNAKEPWPARPSSSSLPDKRRHLSMRRNRIEAVSRRSSRKSEHSRAKESEADPGFTAYSSDEQLHS